MAAKVRFGDGREITVALPAKHLIELLEQSSNGADHFMRVKTVSNTRMWINPGHVAAVEDRPDLD